MNHLRPFKENAPTHEFAEVDFTGGGDGVYALYIDGKLYKYGDYYHDKIEVWIEAFIEGIEWTGANFTHTKIKCENKDLIENISHLGDIPPKNLNETK